MAKLRYGISELAEQLDVLATSIAPNGETSSRKGRIALYDTGSGFEVWVNTNGLLTWQKIAATTGLLWEIDGTETRLVTADEIDMQSKKIINLLDPTADQDAATKKFHDDDMDAEMDTSTGHDHDGSDSKQVLATNLDETGIADGHFLKRSGSAIVGAAVPPALSNVLFSWFGSSEGKFHSTSTLNNSSPGAQYSSFWSTNAAYETVTKIKFKKISGVSTVTIYAFLGIGGGATAGVQVDIGGQSNQTTSNSSGAWQNYDIDVSGLSDGTVYDVVIQLKASGNAAHLYSIIAFGS